MLKNIFIILSLFFTLLQAKELDKVSLQLRWKYQFEFAGFIMAKEKGFYEDVGLDVELREYSTDINIEDEVLSQRANYGIYSSSMLLSYLKGKPIKLMASFFKRSAMVILTKPEIRSPKDLLGKRVMAANKEDFDLNFQYMFKRLDMDTNDLTLVKHTYNVNDFAEGKVDAVTAFISDQPYKLDKLGVKYTILDPSDYGIYSLMLELFTSEKEAKEHLQRTQKFKEASIKGWAYALKHIDESVDVIHAKYAPGLSKELLLDEAHKINKLILPYAYEIGGIDESYLLRQARSFEDIYNLKKHEQIESFIFNKKKSIDYGLLWKMLEVFIILLGLVFFFYVMLRKHNKKLRQWLNATIDATAVFKDGKLIEANDVFLELYGYDSLDEVKNRSAFDFVPKEEHALLKMKLKDSQKPYEIDLIKKDGTVFSALVRGTIIDEHIRIASAIDLTELKRAEEENRYLTERMALAFDGSRDGLWDWNLIDNSVYFSPRWKEMLGYEDDELENTFEAWQSRIHPDDLDALLKDVTLSLEDKEKVFENKHRLRHKEGHWVWIYDRGKVQRDKEGKAIRMIGTHTDLSTEINLNNELNALNTNLNEQVNTQVAEIERQHLLILQKAKLASLGEMLNNIAHQWRQPLNCINSDVAVMSAVVEDETMDKERLLSQIEKIEDNTQYLSDTIDNFSNFFRLDKQKVTFLIHDVVTGALSLLMSRRENVEIEIMQHTDVALYAFKEEYRQVIMVILNNALDNFESRKIKKPKIVIAVSEDKEATYLSVCDNGGGIEKENMDRIFDPYFTTKFANEGVGLGLYMAKMLTEESMQGRLEAWNEEDGVCFKITVPKTVTKGVSNV